MFNFTFIFFFSFFFFEDSLCEGINFDCPDEANDCFRFWMRWANFQNPAWKWNFAFRYCLLFWWRNYISHQPLAWQITTAVTEMNPIIYHEEIYMPSYFSWWCLNEDCLICYNLDMMWVVKMMITSVQDLCCNTVLFAAMDFPSHNYYNTDSSQSSGWRKAYFRESVEKRLEEQFIY